MNNINKSIFGKNKKYHLIFFVLLFFLYIYIKLNKSYNNFIIYIALFILFIDYLFFILLPFLKYLNWKYFKLNNGDAIFLGGKFSGSPKTIFIKEKNIKKIKIYDTLISNGYAVKQGFLKIGEIRRDFGDQDIVNRFIGYNGLENYIFKKIDNNGQTSFIIKINNDEYMIKNNTVSFAGKNVANWTHISDGVVVFYFKIPTKTDKKIILLIALSSVLS